MGRTETQAVNSLLRWGPPRWCSVSEECFCEAALLLACQARRAFSASLGLDRSPFP